MGNSTMGIYKIENIFNNKVYIGSANNLRKRELEHFRDLNKGVHPNKHLQYAFLKSGDKAFTHEILERIEDKEILLKRELYWINKYNSMNSTNGYNFCPPAKGGEASKIFRQKVEGERNGRVKIKAKDIPVICTRLNNGDSQAQISRTYGITYQIIKNIQSGTRWRDLAEMYLSDEILSTWKIPAMPKGIHPDDISIKTLMSICKDINRRVSDEEIADKYGLSETGVGVIRKGGCRSSETINLLNDEVLILWPYNIHLVEHLECKKPQKKPKMITLDKSNPRQKLTNTQVVEICRLLKDGAPIKAIGEMYHVSRQTIEFIKNGKSHKNITELHLFIQN